MLTSAGQLTRVQRALLTRWRRLLAAHWVALLTASLCLALVFSKVAKEVLEGQPNEIDARIRPWVLAHRTGFGNHFFAGLSLLGSTVATLILVPAIALYLWRRKGHMVAAVFISAPAAAISLLLAIRQLVARQRPPGATGIVSNPSFPGGHMIVATSLWVTLMYLLWRERLLPLLPALVVAAGWPLLVGISRVYLDVHWPSDVVAGWLLGMSLALAAAAIYERWRVKGGSSAAARPGVR
jgi:membrane-associated phospholipid phosphatase